MLARLKSAFQRALSEGDLLRVIEHRIKTPPMPQDWLDAAASIRAKADGGSLLELWRERFRGEIKRIAEEPTWALQRAKLLERVMETYTWTALQAAIGDATHEAAWLGHVREGFPAMATLSPERCQQMITQQVLLAACTEACLVELGSALYNVDTLKRMELQVIEVTHRETQVLQVRLHDDLLTQSEGDPELRKALVAWHDTHCVSLLNAEWGKLSALEEAVRADAFDTRKAEEHRRSLQERLVAVLGEMPMRITSEDAQ
ncbi:hypothetical protein [Gemmatimonas sp.]|jgi:hypothetical protein|uniref:hypothetical protein n=1 Tax=Gemmatimonas sp. TaxID=1962908 RepID=UPI0037BFAA79